MVMMPMKMVITMTVTRMTVKVRLTWFANGSQGQRRGQRPRPLQDGMKACQRE